jgi:endonuclease/exonuclease/phosphatase (EEP) superfamily protein YafD
VARSVTPFAARTTALGAAVLALSLAVSSTASGSEQADDTTAEATSSTVRIITYNAGAKLKVSTAMNDLKSIMAKSPDVITLQEMASAKKRKKIREKYIDCYDCVWAANMPGPPVPGETPILYRTDRFDLVESGSVKVTDPTYVGKAGAGPSTINAKYVNWVRLRDERTGRTVYVLNNHTVPSVQGKSGGPNKRAGKRLDIYRKHMGGLQDLVRGISENRWGLVFVTGDLNVNYRRDRALKPGLFPYTRLGNVGLQASYQAIREPKTGTHRLKNGNDKRLIDYVYFLPRKSIEAKKQRILMGYASDHRPLQVEFSVKHQKSAAVTGRS